MDRKFNKAYPPTRLIATEAARSLRGVLIATLFDALVNAAHARGALVGTGPAMAAWALPADTAGDPGACVLVAVAVAVELWGDTHFYWTHRLLHTPWLYRHVHKVHHESFNPDPFSGLSMHWFESAVYFSSAPLVAAFVPLWVFRLVLKGLIVSPLLGHWGHGTWRVEGVYNHYIHHTKFNWNYGSSPLWDHLCGTNFVGNCERQGGARAAAARRQAALAGGAIAEGLHAVAGRGRRRNDD